MINQEFHSRILNGLTYQSFINQAELKVEQGLSAFPDEEKFNHVKLNLQRSKRIEKYYNPSEEIIALINKITSKQVWLILTEDWCGDSAQNLPYIFSFSRTNPNIQLTIIERDKNLDLMEFYKTNGTLSIPKVVIFNDEMEELANWGPRPLQAIQLVNQLKAEGKTKEEFIVELHKWYSKNNGMALEAEFIELLKF